MDGVLALPAVAVDPAPGEFGSSIGPFLRFGTIYPAASVVGGPTGIEAEVRTGDVAWRRARVQGALPWNVGRLLFAVVADVTTVSDEAPPDAMPALGDDHALPGFGWGEGRAPTRALGGLDAAWPAFLGGYARIRLRTAAIGRALDTLADARWTAGAEAALTWWTPFGNVTFDGGVTRDGDWRLNMNVGTAF
jgi:hypothetical protein